MKVIFIKDLKGQGKKGNKRSKRWLWDEFFNKTGICCTCYAN